VPPKSATTTSERRLPAPKPHSRYSAITADPRPPNPWGGESLTAEYGNPCTRFCPSAVYKNDNAADAAPAGQRCLPHTLHGLRPP
jgi:hypothetical protein